MKTAQDVREYAAQKGLAEEAALQAAMKEKAEEFKKSGAQIYVEGRRLKAPASNSKRQQKSNPRGSAADHPIIQP